jgi:acyl-CoA synthetase (AMP-forming)/AMP-acid ligase II
MDALQESNTLANILRRQAASRPDATALIFEDRVTGYAALDRHASQVANGLAGLGIRRHDRVGYLGRNSDLYFELLFGAARLGAVLVPLNWRLAPPEIGAIVADAGITTLFVGPGFDAVPAALGLSYSLQCIAMDGASGGWPDFVAWRDGADPTERAFPVAADDTVLQLYTSGTTGVAKGVELTNAGILNLFMTAEIGGPIGFGPEDVVLVCMPVSHVAGTNIGLAGLVSGAAVVVMAMFDPAALIGIIPRHGVTSLILVPAAILLLVQHPDCARADFRSVTQLLYGASPIAEVLVEQARTVFPNAGLWHLYGLTEACGGGTFLPPAMHDPALGKLRSCGRPYPGFELHIVDPAGQPVPAGTVGEIVIRSPTLMKGYWNNPEATRNAFFPGGWLRTGDAAYRDDDGFVYVHDRVKNMIVTGGENVYPAEVENALFGHPAIAEVAVIGVPDPRWGEAVKAIVALRPDQAASEAELIAYARQRIAGFKLPKSVDFVDALPRNATGKVLHRALRERYWKEQDRLVS